LWSFCRCSEKAEMSHERLHCMDCASRFEKRHCCARRYCYRPYLEHTRAYDYECACRLVRALGLYSILLFNRLSIVQLLCTSGCVAVRSDYGQRYPALLTGPALSRLAIFRPAERPVEQRQRQF
jgi:hypothetical protein